MIRSYFSSHCNHLRRLPCWMEESLQSLMGNQLQPLCQQCLRPLLCSSKLILNLQRYQCRLLLWLTLGVKVTRFAVNAELVALSIVILVAFIALFVQFNRTPPATIVLVKLVGASGGIAKHIGSHHVVFFVS